MDRFRKKPRHIADVMLQFGIVLAPSPFTRIGIYTNICTRGSIFKAIQSLYDSPGVGSIICVFGSIFKKESINQ